MLNSTRVLSAFMMLTIACGAIAQDQQKSKAEQKKEKIDGIAKEALATLFAEDANARDLYDAAYGYAVFSNIKVAFGISAGGGSGVAVAKAEKERTYMKMGTGGIGFGLGGQKYRVIFLFDKKEGLDDFVMNGWQADTSAHAVAGTAGKNAESTFTKGLAVYQLSSNGLMLQADISGSKYWVDKKLNRD